MKRLMILSALIMGVVFVKSQSNDLHRGITEKLPYRQMVTPCSVRVTFTKTVRLIFPSTIKYTDLGGNYITAGRANGAENAVRVKITIEGFPGETNLSVICEDGSFYSFNAKYVHKPEMLDIEMKDFLENEDVTDFSHTRMSIYFRELSNEGPLLVKLIMQSIYKNNDQEIKHLGCKRPGVQFLVRGIYSHGEPFYFHTQAKNNSNVPFGTDFIRFKIVDKKITRRTAIQETVIDPVWSYSETLVVGGRSIIHTVYTVPQFIIPDDRILVIELVEKSGDRHQTIRVENLDIVIAKVINESKTE